MNSRATWGQTVFLVAVLCDSGRSQSGHTTCISVSSSEVQGDAVSYYPSVSGDGRFAAFVSHSSNLVAGDTNGRTDVFLRDRQSGLTTRVSVDSLGVQGNGDCHGTYHPTSISVDGRYVAFESASTNLVSGDTNGSADVFLHDRQSGQTSRVSVDSLGAQGDLASDTPALSADGRYVAFRSSATHLVPGDTNGVEDIFVRDRQSGQTSRVNVHSSGAQANAESGEWGISISSEGRYVVFDSIASNLVTPGTLWGNVYVHDRENGQTRLVSEALSGGGGDFDSADGSISADGRFVAFTSYASDLVPGDSNVDGDVFVRDLLMGLTSRVSVSSGGTQGNGRSSRSSLSPDGGYVAFHSLATNLVPGDNGISDVYVRDLSSGQTRRVSVDSSGNPGNSTSTFYGVSVSAGGRYAAFTSFATNLVPGDANASIDVFLHDGGATAFTSFCDPGFSGVISCPCSNPSAGLLRGCDNSSATGGASLSASGISYLSADGLVFNTSGEKPTALSILLQGNTFASSGIVFGQGVRCVGGTLKRLFVKSASGGSITAPDFGAGDPAVSARSAAKGDPIQAGQSRHYAVYYRDPVVLGGCPASSTFNATQTGRIDWSL